MKATIWIKTKLWKRGYFAPELMGSEQVLFSTRYKQPLIANVIDGGPTQRPWPFSAGSTSLTESFFIRLRPIVLRYPAAWVYITNPDNALSVINWEREIDARYFSAHVLEVFEREPAAEGGVSQLVLFFLDHAGMIVFELEAEDIRIVYYGTSELLSIVLGALNDR